MKINNFIICDDNLDKKYLHYPYVLIKILLLIIFLFYFLREVGVR